MKDLSLQAEQYLAQIVADGLFPSKEAAIEAAVAALREKTEPLFLLDEHMALVEEAIESSNSGQSSPMTTDDWDSLRQRAHDIASNSTPNGA